MEFLLNSMPDARDLPSVVDAAEQAAAAGDYVSAERLLQEALALQETTLGPLHPDLANTLNNLGVVYEFVEKPDDAERCYRRAYSIAAGALAPDHPFVATSRKNLSDFYQARGKPVELPAAPEAVRPDDDRPAAGRVEPPRQPPSRDELPAPAAKSSGPLLVTGAVCVAALVIAVLLWSGSNAKDDSTPGSTTPSSTRGTVVPPREPAAQAAAEETVGTQRSSPAAPADKPTTSATAPAILTLAEALLCRDLSPDGSRGLAGDWECERPSRPIRAGQLLFYTRVRSARDATIQHRWFLGTQLRQSVDLRIRANPTSGYRTYSRNTVYPSAEDWKVEIRTKDGALLHEEHFVVR